MKLKMIVAMDNKNGIGFENSIPWYYPEDLKYFSKVTKGAGNNAIVMGKNTWKSLPKHPLPGRDNLILSTSEYFEGDRYKTFSNIGDLEKYCDKYDEVWVIGGADIYELFIHNILLEEINVTRINRTYKCDTFFPEIPYAFNLNNIKESFLDI